MHDKTADSEREGIVACGASRLIVLMFFIGFPSGPIFASIY